MSDEIKIPQEKEFKQSQQLPPDWLLNDEERTAQSLQNFMFIIWFVNPNKNNVRIILNDGDIKMTMKRDRFLKIMTDLIGPKTYDQAYSLFRIKKSLESYGIWYYYNKIEDDFREIGFEPDFEHINPIDLINETRKSVVKEKLQDNFKEINNEFNDLTGSILEKQKPVNTFEKFFKVIRNMGTKNKKTNL